MLDWNYLRGGRLNTKAADVSCESAEPSRSVSFVMRCRCKAAEAELMTKTASIVGLSMQKERVSPCGKREIEAFARLWHCTRLEFPMP